MRPLSILPLFIVGGCVDYEFHTPADLSAPLLDTGLTGSATTPDDTAGGDDTGPDPGPGSDSGTPTDTSDGIDPPDRGDPPDFDTPPDGQPPATFVSDDCIGGKDVAMSPDTLVVLGWDPITDSGTISAPSRGFYDLYDTTIAESGTQQWNESAYVRVSNTTNPSGKPNWANCGADWVVIDADNHGFPSSSLIYLGTFWLDAGDNTLTLLHYCERQRAGECLGLHITDDPDSTCASGSPNSVHVEAHGLCAVPNNGD
jgi:hypothetical protein